MAELLQWASELMAIMAEIKAAAPDPVEQEPLPEPPVQSSFDKAAFFEAVRPKLFTRLTASQVSGMEAKIDEFIKAGWPVSWAAYALATSYHETARKMQPVREGLGVSDDYRKRHFRYYPYYGRGDVQLTWKENYLRADKELGLNGELLNNLDKALDPTISAKIMVLGMAEGWFSGDRKGRHTLARHLPNAQGTFPQFTNARRIINLLDKASMIAAYALDFQKALLAGGYDGDSYPR